MNLGGAYMFYSSTASPFGDLMSAESPLVPLRSGHYAKAINFDNAATTPPLKAVLEEILQLAPWYASVHRGSGYASQFVSHYYEAAREMIATFVGADLNHDTVIFVKNTTEAINKAAYLLATAGNQQVVLTTTMEHHSNDLPWRRDFKVDHIHLTPEGRLSLEDLEQKLKQYQGQVRLVAVTGASNVTGYKNPIYDIAALCHRYGTEIFVDGAQLMAHAPMDMLPQDHPCHIDYLAFSSHKMYAPFGIGVLIGPQKSFTKTPPHLSGGGTVDLVTEQEVFWNQLPHREEAGSPNFMGVAALVAAMKALRRMGLKGIEAYEHHLMAYALEGLQEIPGITLYSDPMPLSEKVSIIPFNLEGMNYDQLERILAMEGGVSLRTGCFCAQPYVQQLLGICPKEMEERMKDPTLPRPGMVRVSFGCYNTFEEIDRFITLLNHIARYPKEYTLHYQHVPDYFYQQP